MQNGQHVGIHNSSQTDALSADPQGTALWLYFTTYSSVVVNYAWTAPIINSKRKTSFYNAWLQTT